MAHKNNKLKSASRRRLSHFAGEIKAIRPAIQRFTGDLRGSVGVYFSLSLLPILFMIGAAVDYGRALSAKAAMQTAADAAVIAVVQASGSTQSQRQSVAQNNVAANLVLLANPTSVTVTEADPSGSKNFYEVAVSGSIPTAIMSVAGIKSMNIAVRSGTTTVVPPGPGNGCVLSLDDSAVDALWDNGNASVSLTNCDIYDNSSNGAALAVGGSATLAAHKVSVTGGVSGASKITAPGGIVTGAARTSDPYAWLNIPAYVGCDYTNYSTNKNDTVSPGVYCGGFSVNSQAVVKMNPGLYIFDGGAFSINGQATLTSVTVGGVSGVTLVFTSSKGSSGAGWPTVTINGGATVSLTAPTTADIAAGNKGINGVLMYGDRNMPVGTSFKLNGGSSQNLSGAVYLPEAAVKYAGTTGQGTANCLQLIGDTITFIGTSTVAISGCGNFNLSTFGQPLTGSTIALVE